MKTDEASVIRDFSTRLIGAQRSIRILESVRWTDDVRDRFLGASGREMPIVDSNWYQARPLGFEPAAAIAELTALERDVRSALGDAHPAGAILIRMCGEYAQVVSLLEHRGMPKFGQLSQELFGSSADRLHSDAPSLAEFARDIKQALNRIEPCLKVQDLQDEANIPGDEAVPILQARLLTSMSIHGSHPAVVADDGIMADAAAGADVIRLRRDALFSKRELRLLEVHEGWVHVGTTRNGHAQPTCRFLSKGTPSSTLTQEGLAVMVEILSLASSPARQHRINNRVLAIEMAENGADFLDVYRFFVDQGFDVADCYQFASRVFRGSTPDGPPFTKDVAYTKGFVQLYNFLRAAVMAGELDSIPLVFCGKTVVEDIPHLRVLLGKALLSPPAFVPPQFSDMHGLAAWMCYDSVFSRLGSEPLMRDYAKLF